jgi:hypothetical protein
MKNNHLQYEARKARIYKEIYRPSTSPFRFLGSLLSIILQGQSRIGHSEVYGRRR